MGHSAAPVGNRWNFTFVQSKAADINKPGYGVLDEATSALDTVNEANLYGWLQQLGINYISVGHRSSIIAYHDSVLELLGHNKWRLLSAQDYRKAAGND